METPHAPELMQREQSQQELELELKERRDRFLDLYTFYKQTRISWIHDELKLKAYELRLLDPTFYFAA